MPEGKRKQKKGDLKVAIDLGSNSFHMMVIRPNGDDFEVVLKEKQRVALAAGLNSKGHLSETAIKRGLACIKLFKKHIENLGEAVETRIVATYTLRAATNSDDFCKPAEKLLGAPIEIISGHQEAELIYRGVAWEKKFNKNSKPCVVIDIGGGSTEVIFGEGEVITQKESFPVGCVSFTKKYFKEGRICQKRYKKARDAVEQLISGWCVDNQIQGSKYQSIGTSGTIKAVAGAVHHRSMLNMPFDEGNLKKLRKCIIKAGKTSKIALDVRADRKAVLPAGLAVLEGAMRALDLNKVQYVNAALREGLVASHWG